MTNAWSGPRSSRARSRATVKRVLALRAVLHAGLTLGNHALRSHVVHRSQRAPRAGRRSGGRRRFRFCDCQGACRSRSKRLPGELAAGANIGTRAQIAGGVRIGEVKTQRDTGSPLLPEHGYEADNRFFLSGVYDTRDDVGLPTRGSLIFLRYVNSDNWLGSEQDYSLVEGVFTKSFPSFRGDSFSLILGGGEELSGNLPPARIWVIGSTGAPGVPTTS